MDVIEGEHVVGDTDRGSRKRKIEKTSRERKKEVRYSDHDPDLNNFKFPCKHIEVERFECEKITKDNVLEIRKSFFQKPDKMFQDNLLASLITVANPKRKRSRKPDGKPHMFSAVYNVIVNNVKMQVCKKLFMSIYSIAETRLRTINKKVMSGEGITEKRGGDKRSFSFSDKLVSVKNFISNLKGKESHYGRTKSQRIYLSSEYNISILWKFYNHSVEENLQVHYKFFSRVFSRHFNIGFGSPATDICSFCVRTQIQINNTKTETEKTELGTQLKVHKMRAAQFHKLMKETPPNTESFCFDLQQVQVLPKVPIQEAFYAQQLSLYFFCITKVDRQTPIFYSWMEHQAGRGATETSSAVLNFLQSTEFSPGIKKIRFFADGCAGQNKNSFMVHLLMYWLGRLALKSITSIDITFPVRGHSYLPADRIFGQIEKVVRRHSVIKSPEKYWELYSKFGEVRKLDTDWSLVDIKDSLKVLKKVTGISSCKRIKIRRGNAANTALIKTETLYRNDDDTKTFETLLKSRRRLDQLYLPDMPLGHEIKKKKLDSLKNLLISLAGEKWHADDDELKWMVPIFAEPSNDNMNKSNEENEDCECESEENPEFL